MKVHDMSHRRATHLQPARATCPTCAVTFEVDRTSCMPFCSERCRQIDLGRWFSEEYGLPVEREEPDDGGNEFNLSDG